MAELNDGGLKAQIEAQTRRAMLGRVATVGSPIVAYMMTLGIAFLVLPEDVCAAWLCGIMAILACAGSAAGGVLVTGRYDTAVFRAIVTLGCGLVGLTAFIAAAAVTAALVDR